MSDWKQIGYDTALKYLVVNGGHENGIQHVADNVRTQAANVMDLYAQGRDADALRKNMDLLEGTVDGISEAAKLSHGIRNLASPYGEDQLRAANQQMNDRIQALETELEIQSAKSEDLVQEAKELAKQVEDVNAKQSELDECLEMNAELIGENAHLREMERACTLALTCLEKSAADVRAVAGALQIDMMNPKRGQATMAELLGHIVLRFHSARDQILQVTT